MANSDAEKSNLVYISDIKQADQTTLQISKRNGMAAKAIISETAAAIYEEKTHNNMDASYGRDASTSRKASNSKGASRREIITVRGQSYVSRLPKC